MGRNLFELLLEQDRQASHDEAYFASAVSRDGRRFSEEFSLREVALYVCANGPIMRSIFEVSHLRGFVSNSQIHCP
jgi:hypothetical protein